MSNARDRIERALKKSKARYTEIRLEETQSTRVVFRGKVLDAVTETLDRGGIVRCLAPEGGWGTATFNDWDSLERKVDEALACARAVPSDKVILADVAPVTDEVRAKLATDFRSVSLATKVETLRAYNEIMLREPEVRSTSTIYRDAMQTVHYGNSNGAWIVEERPLIDFYCTAEAVRGDDVQTATEAQTMANKGFESVLGREDMARVFTLFPRLKERTKQVAGTMSGGEQQMLAIGRAMMARPTLLLLDEPSMGLAPILVEQIFATVVEINKSGVTILLVEQNAARTVEFADRTYVLRSGSLALEWARDA